MSKRDECAECDDRGRCGSWFLMKHLMWVHSVDLTEGVLTVKHNYPEGVDVSRHIRELIREKGITMTVELRVVREEP